MAPAARRGEIARPRHRIRRRHREPRQINRLLRPLAFKKRVAERDFMHVLRARVSAQARIHEEIHRHLHFGPRRQPLLVEAEALDLLEVDPRLLRRHVERRMPHNRMVRQVLRLEQYQRILPQPQLHRTLQRHESPRQPRRHIGVEQHRHHPVGHMHRIRLRPLRGAVGSGHLTEQPVQRHRVAGNAAHHPQRQTQRRDGVKLARNIHDAGDLGPSAPAGKPAAPTRLKRHTRTPLSSK